jgi:hypothetical protein
VRSNVSHDTSLVSLVIDIEQFSSEWSKTVKKLVPRNPEGQWKISQIVDCIVVVIYVCKFKFVQRIRSSEGERYTRGKYFVIFFSQLQRASPPDSCTLFVFPSSSSIAEAIVARTNKQAIAELHMSEFHCCLQFLSRGFIYLKFMT